jgi:hypothetical protein
MIRSIRQHSVRLAVACTAVILPLRAAGATDVWVVDQGGGGDFTAIQPAVDAAADGDTVLVRAGSYAGFAVNSKGVAVVADVGALVELQGSVQIVNLPIGSVAHLAGLSVLASGHADVTLNSGLYLQNNHGVVRGFDCSFEGAWGYPWPTNDDTGREGAVFDQNKDVAFTRCSFTGTEARWVYNCCDYGYDGGDGVYSQDTVVAFYDCLLQGGKGGDSGWGGVGGAGCEFINLGLFASGSVFRGGEGGTGEDFIYGPGGPGGDGLIVHGQGQARLTDCLFEGGPGGIALTFGPDGPPGQQTSGAGSFYLYQGPARSTSVVGMWWEGASLPLFVGGEPGDRVFLIASTQTDFFFQEALSGTWLVPHLGFASVIPAGIIDASGILEVELDGFDLDSGDEASSLYVQAICIDTNGTPILAGASGVTFFECIFSVDCDGNGTPDACDIASGTHSDCNSNGVPDLCEGVPGTSPDCNGNGVPDECDIESGTSVDCNENDIPDSCEFDCNGNGIADECDVANGTSEDCDANQVPDECDIDCNANGVPDTCDISNGTSQDNNQNGVPDECQTPNDVYYVDASADPQGDGTPQAPFNTIQAGVDYSIDGNTIVLLDGVYKGDGNREVDLGGRSITIESAGDATTCDINCEDQGRAFIVTGAGVSVTVRGVTIRNGDADHSTSAPWHGGAIYVAAADVLVDECFITHCRASVRGGGLSFAGGGESVVRGTTMRYNHSGGIYTGDGGGAIHVDGAATRVTVEDCSIKLNSAAVSGGGIASNQAQVGVRGSAVALNQAGYSGGGLFALTGTLEVFDCVLGDNWAALGGGLAADGLVTVTVTHTVFGGNQASSRGGGIDVHASDPTIVIDNCLFTANGGSGTHAGAMSVFGYETSSVLITNTTFVANAGSSGGALSLSMRGSQEIHNSVFWGNTAVSDGPQIYMWEDATLTYSAVQGGQADIDVNNGATLTYGPGNIERYPSFLDPNGADDDVDTWEDNDFSLSLVSPCIDAADNAQIAADELDADGDGDTTEEVPLDLGGDPRRVDDPAVPDTGSGAAPVLDMGAYERQP